jgi:membrane fusion protein (multidrug efflux system)
MVTMPANSRMGRPMKWMAPVVVALALAGCKGDEAEGKAASQAAPPPPPPVVVAEIKTQGVPLVRDFVARTEAQDTITIQARVEAILESRHFEEGRPVSEGQVLYELDKRTYQATLQEATALRAGARANLKLAEEQVSVRAAEAELKRSQARNGKAQQDVARLEPLAAQDAVPQQDLDTAVAALEVTVAEVEASEALLVNSRIQEEVGILQARAAVQSAEAAVQLAELDLGYCTITCPIDGLIGRTIVSVGNLVGRGESTDLAMVSSIDPMLATLSISEEEYLTFLAARAEREASDSKPERPPVRLILADDSIYEHGGEVITFERAVDLQTGTLQVVVRFPNPEGDLRDGQFGRVRVVLDTLEGAVLVPQRAIMEQQGTKTVLVLDEKNVVSLRTLTLTERFEQFFVVADGLAAGDRVVLEGQMKARPGMEVKPVDSPVSSEPGEQ